LSSVGIGTGPAEAAGTPKPMSSISTITTLGAPLGALTSKRGGALTLKLKLVKKCQSFAIKNFHDNLRHCDLPRLYRKLQSLRGWGASHQTGNQEASSSHGLDASRQGEVTRC
jgi:hypothetical protein